MTKDEIKAAMFTKIGEVMSDHPEIERADIVDGVIEVSEYYKIMRSIREELKCEKH